MKRQPELVELTGERIAADALLLPVDGQLCRLGGAAAGALCRSAARSASTARTRSR